MSRYKIYNRPSIADMLLRCDSEEAVQVLIVRALKELEPSAATKRKWANAAAIRVGQLKVAKLLSAS